MKKTVKFGIEIIFLLTLFTLPCCTSVFSGGTGGIVVDAESTSNPKEGIANVDVYAYTDSGARDSDFSAWKDGTLFVPKAEYYGHTTTDIDGSFVISRLVWKENKPDFGKDADSQKIYLLFYHENYGLTKGDTLIVSDSTSDTVYAELTAVRKSTNLSLNFVDVTSGNQINSSLYVTISVPQTTGANTEAEAIVYEREIAGAGTINISYPRWQNADDKTAGKETEPVVTIKYFQSAEEITWKGCYNEDNQDKNFAFREDAQTGISKVVKNKDYSLTFYGKATKLNMPVINGQYNAAKNETDDGVVISMKRSDGSAYTIDCGQVSTYSQTIGTSGTEKHGIFSNLGAGFFWTDNSYTGKYAEADVEIYADGVAKKQMKVRSDSANYTIQLN